ncbi:pyridoxamine 5'-phosphate oxidase family protein [Jiangella alkaliphila]|uniref:Pyridoxamine 5'-phosphate oxidase n=1 Tax=Jiangella alkaliphila TaxID=419479 RepID=A0A1H2KWZ6_9ACTN|nr:pyridoxamine 5'-phosphate oxidase family protein [Jiangella alkaliphila]SDU73085.1 Pyridoxamine 5'-phosphate oxidase [Jiangella alkaliphila]
MLPSTPAGPGGADPLDRPTCYALLARAPIGRLVFTEGALPAIEPVVFELDGDDVVVRFGLTPSLPPADRLGVVAFQADEYDPVARTGWCVVTIGRSTAEGDGLRIRPEIVRGRRIVPSGEPAAA